MDKISVEALHNAKRIAEQYAAERLNGPPWHVFLPTWAAEEFCRYCGVEFAPDDGGVQNIGDYVVHSFVMPNASNEPTPLAAVGSINGLEG